MEMIATENLREHESSVATVIFCPQTFGYQEEVFGNN
jgi:hypothetical protein